MRSSQSAVASIKPVTVVVIGSGGLRVLPRVSQPEPSALKQRIRSLMPPPGSATSSMV
jgi:uncharacterized spore protein YtfJ